VNWILLSQVSDQRRPVVYKVMNLLFANRVRSLSGYASIVGMRQLLVCVHCWYASIVDMCQLLVCVHCWYTSIIGMRQLLICVNCWYASIVGMRQLLICVRYWYASIVGMRPLLVYIHYWYASIVDMSQLLVCVHCWYASIVDMGPLLVCVHFCNITEIMLANKTAVNASASCYVSLSVVCNLMLIYCKLTPQCALPSIRRDATCSAPRTAASPRQAIARV
jgi:hypothetical protein